MMDFEGILGILLIAVILWMIIQLINKKRSNNLLITDQQAPAVKDENAPGILKKRFDRGEISQFEYERMEKNYNKIKK